MIEVRSRADDYYLALVGELFDRMREGYTDSGQWARLGNALALFVDRGEDYLHHVGVAPSDAALFAAAAFYSGGYPASAYLTIRKQPPVLGLTDETQLACFDFLARPTEVRSRLVRGLLAALRSGRRRSSNIRLQKPGILHMPHSSWDQVSGFWHGCFSSYWADSRRPTFALSCRMDTLISGMLWCHHY